MSKFGRKKIAVTLAFAALFGNKTSAINSKYEASGVFTIQKSSKSGAEISNPRGTLNIRSDSSGNKFFNWVKNHKAVSVAISSAVVAGAVGLTIWGVKHKSKGNQNPDQIPGQNPEEENKDQNLQKGNEKGDLPPNNLSNNPNLVLSQQQQIQCYANFASKYLSAQIALSFASAVVRFNSENPDKKLENDFISKILLILGTYFPAGLKDNQNFIPLANLKHQQNVRFEFAKHSIFGNVNCYVYIGDLVYDFYTYGGADSFNVIMGCHKYVKQGENVQWPLVERIKRQRNIC